MAKIAFVMVSGGSLTAYPAGYLAGAGLEPSQFDVFFGVSGGFGGASAFATGQLPTHRWNWLEELAHPRVVSLANFRRTGYLIDLDYLIDHGLRDLRIEECLAEGTELYAGVARLSDGEVRYVRATPENFRTLGKATCAIPRLAPPVALDGEHHVDGAVSEPNPVHEALRQGYRRILVMENLPEGSRIHRFERHLAHFMFPFASRGAKETFARRAENYARAWEVMLDPPDGVEIKCVAPSRDSTYNALSIDKAQISAAMECGERDGERDAEALHDMLARWRAQP